MPEFVRWWRNPSEIGKIESHEIRANVAHVWVRWLKGGMSLVPLAELAPTEVDPISMLANLDGNREDRVPRVEFYRP